MPTGQIVLVFAVVFGVVVGAFWLFVAAPGAAVDGSAAPPAQGRARGRHRGRRRTR